MEDVMREFAQLATERPTELRALKADGKKIVPYIGQFVPEELLYAAGVEPYLVCRGGEPEPPEAVLDDMLRFLNPLARSMAGFHLMGLDPVMPLADLRRGQPAGVSHPEDGGVSGAAGPAGVQGGRARRTGTGPTPASTTSTSSSSSRPSSRS